MKVGIVGTRTFDDYELLKESILEVVKLEEIDMIVSGGAKGADALAEKFADEFGIKKNIFKPEWTLYGNNAGFLRNTHIVDSSDMLFAFWDGESSGTKDSIEKAQKNGEMPVYVIYYKKES